MCGLSTEKYTSREQLTKEEEWIKQIQQEDATNKDQHMAMLHACGVTIEWLLAFTFDHNCWDKPTWWVNRHIIKEATRHNRRRYMDLDEMKQYKRPATVFMSHCWGAVWGDVVLAACHGARFGRVVWIDLFAVRQWPGNKADLDFRNVINKCQAFIVSVSPVDGLKEFIPLRSKHKTFLASDKGKAAKRRVPTFRLWCNVEIAAAYKKIPIVIKGGKATKEDDVYNYDTECIGKLLQNLQYMIDIEASETTNPEDYEREMKIVRSLDGGVQGVNMSIAGVVVGAVTSTIYNVLEIDAFMCNECEAFRELNIPLGCQGDDRILAIEVLSAACGGGRKEIVRELLLEWNVKDNKEKEGETKKKDSVMDEILDQIKSLFQENYVYQYNEIITSINAQEQYSEQQIQTALKQLLEDKNELMLDMLGNEGNLIAIGDCYMFQPTEIKEKKENAEWLIQLIDESKVLVFASRGGHVRVVEMLLEVVGVDVNIAASGGSTALYCACCNSDVNVVKLLLGAKDIKVNYARDDTGYTPLLASMDGDINIVQLLLDVQEIDVNLPDRYGSTPLWMASQNGYTNLVELLLGATNMNVNQSTEVGCTPLMMAIQNGHENVIDLLLNVQDIDVYTPSDNGVTSLFGACQSGLTTVVRHLLSFPNININQSMDNGATPLIIASYLGNYECVQQLLQQPTINTTLIFQNKTALQWSQLNERAKGWEYLDKKINIEGRTKIRFSFSKQMTSKT